MITLGGRVLPLGHGAHHDVPVRDNAADLIILDDDHVANVRVPHGAGGLVHRRRAGQGHGVGVMSSRICWAIRGSFSEAKSP